MMVTVETLKYILTSYLYSLTVPMHKLHFHICTFCIHTEVLQWLLNSFLVFWHCRGAVIIISTCKWVLLISCRIYCNAHFSKNFCRLFHIAMIILHQVTWKFCFFFTLKHVSCTSYKANQEQDHKNYDYVNAIKSSQNQIVGLFSCDKDLVNIMCVTMFQIQMRAHDAWFRTLNAPEIDLMWLWHRAHSYPNHCTVFNYYIISGSRGQFHKTILWFVIRLMIR
jgi:hypothetical protein